LFGLIGDTPRMRELRVQSSGRGLNLRVGRFGAIGRGTGVDELVLARRLARRLGFTFELAVRRGGRRELRLGWASQPARVREPEPHATVS